MVDEYAFLRSQYLEIIEHSDYLLKHSPDPMILARAKESKRCAEYELERLNRSQSPLVAARGR